MNDYISWIWAIITVALVIVEACTVQLVTIWFAIGSLIGLILSFFKVPVYIQIIAAVVASLAALILTRPAVKKLHAKKAQPTNADRVLGKDAVVIEEINNLDGKGLVKVGGIEWTARSVDDFVHPKGEIVSVERIEGVKLIVTQKNR